MRLINIKTLQLEEFQGVYTPNYVILSHRWSDDEITLKDFVKGRRKNAVGYRKVIDFCAKVREYAVDIYRETGTSPFGYAWIDTICIDKASSAELSESINSMWTYYEQAEICFVHMVDVDYPRERTGRETRLEGTRFQSGVWFQRGWTLQELLAPKSLAFFTESWLVIGYTGRHANDLVLGVAPTRRQELLAWISCATGISDDILDGNRAVRQSSIAERMSWLASRTTTRPEDIAYCALGLFGVHMPLLYGEGSNAFQRLQEEMIKTSNDESIFAWSMYEPDSCDSILAESPQDFLRCAEMRRALKQKRIMPYAMTNQGLEMRLPRYIGALSTTTPSSFSHQITQSLVHRPYHSALIPLNCMNSMGYPFIIALVEKECGHFDRQDGDQPVLRSMLAHSMDILQEDKTIYVHTPNLREACRRVYTLDEEARRHDPHRLEDIIEEV